MNRLNFPQRINYLFIPLLIIGITSIVTSLFGYFHLLDSFIYKIYSIISVILIFLCPAISLLKDLHKIKSYNKYIVGCIFILLGSSILASLAPPFTWDEVAYNLGLPKQYLQIGYFKYIGEYGLYSAFPLFADAINTTLLNGGTYIATHVLGVWSYFSLGLITYYLSSSLNLKKPFSFLSCALILSSPCIFFTSPTSKPDNLVAVYFLSSIYLLLHDLKLSKFKLYEPKLILSVIFMSFALGFKYSCIYLLPAYFTIVFIIIKNKKDKILPTLIYFLTFSGLLFLLINSVWLYRNFIETGNPVFPMLNSIIGDNLPFHFTSYRSNLMFELLYSMKDMSFKESGSLFTFLNKIRSQSFLIPFLFIPIAIFLIYRSKTYSAEEINLKYKAMLYATLLTLAELFFILTWELRHIVSIFPLVFILFSFTLSAFFLGKNFKLLDKLIYIISILLIIYSAGKIIKSFKTPLNCISMNINNILNCGQNKVYSGNLAFYLDKHLNENDVVALNIQPFFYLKSKYLMIHPWTEMGNFLHTDTPAEMFVKLKKMHVTFIAWANMSDQSSIYNERIGSNIGEWFIKMDSNISNLSSSGYLEKVENIDGIDIYKIK